VIIQSTAAFDVPRPCGYTNPVQIVARERLDRCWRKARIAARILLREEQGRLTPRDVRLGRMLAKDPGVTNRLIDQALYGFSGRKYRLAVSRRTATR
jgi:hypothetical protein